MIDRANELRTDEKAAKNFKKKSFVDLLRNLPKLGLSYHSLARDQVGPMVALPSLGGFAFHSGLHPICLCGRRSVCLQRLTALASLFTDVMPPSDQWHLVRADPSTSVLVTRRVVAARQRWRTERHSIERLSG